MFVRLGCSSERATVHQPAAGRARQWPTQEAKQESFSLGCHCQRSGAGPGVSSEEAVVAARPKPGLRAETWKTVPSMQSAWWVAACLPAGGRTRRLLACGTLFSVSGRMLAVGGFFSSSFTRTFEPRWGWAGRNRGPEQDRSITQEASLQATCQGPNCAPYGLASGYFAPPWPWMFQRRNEGRGEG